jgi:hypothetical protein
VTSLLAGALPRNVASADCAQVTLGLARIAAMAAPSIERENCFIRNPSRACGARDKAMHHMLWRGELPTGFLADDSCTDRAGNPPRYGFKV